MGALAAREPDAETARLESGFASWSLAGTHASGDRHLVNPFPSGALVAVVDALGHGPDAAAVARLAIATLETHPDQPVVALMKRSDEALRTTRGAVMSLARFDHRGNTVSWLGVGNVEGVLIPGSPTVSARHSFILRGGVVGYRLPSLQPTTVAVHHGDLLILATDGVRSDFADGVTRTSAPKEIADSILARCGKRSDDALVLVVRWLGGDA